MYFFLKDYVIIPTYFKGEINMKVEYTVEYNGNQTKMSDLVPAIKKAITERGIKLKDVKLTNVYFQPENNKTFVVAVLADGSEIDFAL